MSAGADGQKPNKTGGRRGGNFDASRSAPRKRPVKPAGYQPQRIMGDRPGLGVRLVAAKLLSAIVDAKTSADGLLAAGNGHPGFRALDARDQGLVKAIVLSALRHRGTIERMISACLDRSLPPNAANLKHILHVGAAQILYLDVPDSAAVDLAVAAADTDSRSVRFKGMVNAVLRRLSREKAAADGEAADGNGDEDSGPDSKASGNAGAPSAALHDPSENLPEWLRARLVPVYGAERTAAMAAAHLVSAPLDLTVKADPAGWAERLGGTVLPTGSVRLSSFDGPVTELPGFAEGEWWVQDAAAALPAKVFGDLRGLSVADLCAAPGGKTAQLILAGGAVTALDINANRLKRLQQNLTRLGLQAETVLGDLGTYEPQSPFDAILLDAPCSSTGTIRRHPDVAYTKDADEVAKLADVQARLLREAAKLLKPGGRLVFSNCSLDPVEGEAVIAAFLAETPAFSRDPIRADEVPGLAAAITPQGELRTTPEMVFGAGGIGFGQHGTDGVDAADPAGLDGFFASRLRLG